MLTVVQPAYKLLTL